MKYNQPAEAIKTEYDLNKPEEKKAIRDFEVLLEELKKMRKGGRKGWLKKYPLETLFKFIV